MSTPASNDNSSDDMFDSKVEPHDSYKQTGIVALVESVRRRRRLMVLQLALLFAAAIGLLLGFSSMLPPPFSFLPRGIELPSRVTGGLLFFAATVSMTRFFTEEHRRILVARESLGLKPATDQNKWEWLWRGDTDPVLEKLENTDRGSVPEEVHRYLYSVLRGYVEFGPMVIGSKQILAALQAVEKVGDERAIPYLERMANRNVKSAGLVRIKLAAQESLDAVRLLVEQDRAGGTLLRPSLGELAKNASLLRPASQTGSAESNTLLRPGD